MAYITWDSMYRLENISGDHHLPPCSCKWYSWWERWRQTGSRWCLGFDTDCINWRWGEGKNNKRRRAGKLLHKNVPHCHEWRSDNWICLYTYTVCSLLYMLLCGFRITHNCNCFMWNYHNVITISCSLYLHILFGPIVTFGSVVVLLFLLCSRFSHDGWRGSLLDT